MECHNGCGINNIAKLIGFDKCSNCILDTRRHIHQICNVKSTLIERQLYPIPTVKRYMAIFCFVFHSWRQRSIYDIRDS